MAALAYFLIMYSATDCLKKYGAAPESKFTEKDNSQALFLYKFRYF
jgi:hypothetical protein